MVAPRAGLEPATERLTAVCSTTELPGIRRIALKPFNAIYQSLPQTPRRIYALAVICGGHARNRTGVHGFAGRCVTTPPRGRHVETRQGEHVFINIRLGSATCFSLVQMFCPNPLSAIVKSTGATYIKASTGLIVEMTWLAQQKLTMN